jgi:hypothetical protein
VWHRGPNRCAHFVKGTAGGFWDPGKVFIVLKGDFVFRHSSAIARVRFFHTSHGTKALNSSPFINPAGYVPFKKAG